MIEFKLSNKIKLYYNMSDITLSKSQQNAFDLIFEGNNVYVGGAGGTGKTRLINTLKNYYNTNTNKKLSLTSTTGISAINIQGRTLHSFAGIGLAKCSKEMLVSKVKSCPDAVSRWREIDILIIDEISMMSCDLFEKIEYVARKIRKNEELFGGLQIVLFGDFFQLTPIISEPREDKKIFCFESVLWNNVITHTIILKKIWRQTDPIYKNILNRIRKGIVKSADVEILNNRVGLNEIPNEIIKLYPINRQVEEENNREFNKINNRPYTYYPNFSGDPELINDLKFQLNQIKCSQVILKETARVMLVINLDQDANLINGSMGNIVRFVDGLPLIKFDNGCERIIDRFTWVLEDNANKDKNKKIATASQIPLILAYAISIHKSQGQTLDNAVISLNNCFAHHQVYVALSRIKELNGLYLTSFDSSKIKVSKIVKDFYKKVKE